MNERQRNSEVYLPQALLASKFDSLQHRDARECANLSMPSDGIKIYKTRLTDLIKTLINTIARPDVLWIAW